MLKKLKDKFAEEMKQSPLKIAHFAQSVVSPTSSSVIEPTSNESFSIGEDYEETPQNSPSKAEFHAVDLRDVPSPLPTGHRSRQSSFSSHTSEASSLFPIYEMPGQSVNLQSDWESASEMDEGSASLLANVSKQELYCAYLKIRRRYQKYKGRSDDLLNHCRDLDRDNKKHKNVLLEHQEKSIRRINELKEQCVLEQRAKAHLEEALRNDLEEKDHLIQTLYTKIKLLRENNSGENGSISNEDALIDLSEDGSASHTGNKLKLEAVNSTKSQPLCVIEETKETQTENSLVISKDDHDSALEELEKSAQEEMIRAIGREKENMQNMYNIKKKLEWTQRALDMALETMDTLVDYVGDTDMPLATEMSSASSNCNAQDITEMAESHELNVLSNPHEISSKLVNETDKILNDTELKFSLLSNSFESLKIKLKESNSELQKSKTENEKLKRALSESENSIRDLREVHKKFSQETINSVKNINNENRKVISQYAIIAKQVNEYLYQVPSLKQALQEAMLNMNEMKSVHQKEHADYEKRCVDLESKLAEASEHIETLNKNLNICSQTKSELENSYKSLTEELSNVNDKFKQKMASLQEEYNDNLCTMKRELDEKCKELAIAVSNMEETEKKCTSVSEQILLMKEEQCVVAELNNSLQKENATLKEEMCNMELKYLSEHQISSEVDVSCSSDVESGNQVNEVSPDSTKQDKKEESKIIEQYMVLLGDFETCKQEKAKLISMLAEFRKSINTVKEASELIKIEVRDVFMTMSNKCSLNGKLIECKLIEKCKEIQTLEVEIMHALTLCEDLEKKVNAIELENTALKQHNETLKIENEELEKQMGALKIKAAGEAANAQTRINSLNENLDLLDKERGELLVVESELTDVISKLRIEVKEQNEKLEQTEAAYQNTVSSLEMENQNAETRIASMAQEVSRTMKLNVDLNKQLEDITVKTEELTAKSAILREEKMNLTAEVNILQKTTLQLQEQLTEESNAFNETMNKLKEEKENLVKNVELLEQQLSSNEHLKFQLQDLSSQNNELQEQLNHARKTNETAEKCKQDIELLMCEIEHLTSSKSELEQQLKDCVLAIQDKEDKLCLLDEQHTQKIKQLAIEFEQRLAEKDEEIQNIQTTAAESKEAEESKAIKQLQDQIRDIMCEYEKKNEVYENLLEDYQRVLNDIESEKLSVEQRIKDLQLAHEEQLNEVNRKWRTFHRKEIEVIEEKHKTELSDLSREWHWERKDVNSDSRENMLEELESTSQLAVAAVESGTGSIELLHKQVVALTQDLKETKQKHRMEVAELNNLLTLRQRNPEGELGSFHEKNIEMEYIRNIMYQYMMGKEPMLLAKVIAAVMKFDPEQTNQIVQREVQKQTLLGQLGIL